MTVGGANGSANGGSRLDSWKAIAAYLGRDVGTVRRWERTRGLPVHRVPGGKGSSVFAYTSEIDTWLQSAAPEAPADVPPEPRRITQWLRAAAAAGAVTVLFVFGWWIQRPRASAADLQVELTEHALFARDVQGRQLWTRELDPTYRHIASSTAEATRVVTGNHPRVYFITSQRIGRADTAGEGGEFTSLEIDGTPRFTFRFHDTVHVGGKPYAEPWAITTFSVLEGDPPSRLAVAAHHWVWGSSLIAILDDGGKRLGTFFNDGWVEQLNWLSPDRLVFGGFYQAKNGGMVGIFNPNDLDGQSPEPAGSAHHCEDCGKALPLAMAVMPRSEINLATQSRFNRAIIEKLGDRLIVRTVEMPPTDGQGAADAIYEFTRDLTLLNVSYSERYWEIHDRLQAEKTLDHGRANCPDRDGPPQIEVWSRDSGWRVLPRKPRA